MTTSSRTYKFNNLNVVAPLTIRSNEPIFESDSLGLKREAYTQGAQRWELDFEVGPDVNMADYLVSSTTQFQKGYTNYAGELFSFFMPQLQEHALYLNENNLTLITQDSGIVDEFDSSPLSITKGNNQVNVTGLPADYDLTGAFISFTEAGAPGSDKVYVITSHNTTTIHFYPDALREIRAGATVNIKNVPFYYTYDDTTLRGMKYSDGIIGSPDTVKIIEDLTRDNRVPQLRFTSTPGTITEGDRAVFTVVSRGISDVRPVAYSGTNSGKNEDAQETYSGTLFLVSDGETTFSFDTETDGILEGNDLEYSVAGNETVTMNFTLPDISRQIGTTTFNLKDEEVKTYSLTSDTTSVTEGSPIQFTLTMRNATENETVPYTITPADANNDLGLGAGYTGGNFSFSSNQTNKNVSSITITPPDNDDTYPSQRILDAYGDDRWTQTFLNVTHPHNTGYREYSYTIPTAFEVATSGTYTLADITGRIRGDQYPRPRKIFGRIVNDPDHTYVKDPKFIITSDPADANATIVTAESPGTYESRDRTTLYYTLTPTPAIADPENKFTLTAGTTYYIVQSYQVAREEDSAYQNHFYVDNIEITPSVGRKTFTLTITPDPTQSITFDVVENPN